MTAKILQNVTPRHSHSHSSRRLQSGRITHTTMTATVGVGALAVIAALGFFYLQQVLNTTSQGTDIHTLESQLIDLKQQQRDLELQGAQLRSLQTVQDRVQKLNLAPAGQVTYLATTPDHVALLTR